MEILIFTIPISITIAIGFLVGFFWAVDDGQFDDVSTPAYRMLGEGEYVEETTDE